MANFNGQLRNNEIFNDLFNQLISLFTFADNINDITDDLVALMRTDGGKYGDTKVFYAAKIPYAKNWLNDAEAANYLTIHRPQDPDSQAIHIDVFKKLHLSTDQYMSARAWGSEGAFTNFNSVMLQTMKDAKRIYEYTTMYTYIGTTESTFGKQQVSVDVTTAVASKTGEEAARIEGGVIGESTANLLVDLKDVTRGYNDYGNRRSSSGNSLVFAWSSKALSKVEARDLPTIYHRDIIDRLGEYVIPSRFYGKPNTKSKTTSDEATRSLIAQEVKLAGTETLLETADIERGGKIITVRPGEALQANDVILLYAGDLMPKGLTIATSSAVTVPTYQEDPTILYKVFNKKSVPFMSGFMVETGWFLNSALVDQHLVVWSHNTLEYLKNYPFVTVRKA